MNIIIKYGIIGMVLLLVWYYCRVYLMLIVGGGCLGLPCRDGDGVFLVLFAFLSLFAFLVVSPRALPYIYIMYYI